MGSKETEDRVTSERAKTVFISGHLDLTQEEFEEHYVPRITEAIASGVRFMVGDAPGCDFMAQRFLAGNGVAFAVYHMLDRPRHCYGTGHGSHDPHAAAGASARPLPHGVSLVGGFVNDEA